MIKNNLKIIFAGTPDFAIPIVKLLAVNYQLLAILTQPDKKIGRKQNLAYSPIKQFAIKHNIPTLQSESLKTKEIFDKIKSLKPDIIIVAAYGKIIPKNILDVPKYGCLNIHASLLPKYRGASPIQYAILNGDKETGVTIIKMNEKMDEGDIIARAKEKIYNDDTSQALHNRLSKLGASLLIKILPDYINKKIKPVPQNHKSATYTKIIKKADGQIDWLQNAQKIENQIRAFNPWPGAFTYIENKRVKIIQAKAINESISFNPSVLFKINGNLAIACLKSYLIINTLQLEGKKPVSSHQFLLGHPNIINKTAK